MSDRGPGAPIVFLVTAEEGGQRLDKIVQRRLSGFGRRAVAALFATGSVRVEGRPGRKGDVAREGTAVTITSELEPIVAEPDAPLHVVLETPQVVVARKPAGQPTVPLIAGERGTFAAALLGRYPELSGVGYRRREPGLLHRLDTQTSGLLVAARSKTAFAVLSRALAEGRLSKRYLAVVEGAGLPDSGRVSAPLAPSPGESRRVAVSEGEGRPAVTDYRVVSRGGRFALALCDVSHAYRHQIRVHLAHMGHPIVGDRLYGGTLVPALGERHALHASYVAWAGDEAVPPFAASDPLPDDLAALLEG